MYIWGDAMNKAAACIKLLEVLNTKSIMSRTELADLINTNPRNINEYIKEIEMAGYSVEAVRGKYGGYRLDSNGLFPVLKLTDSEKEVIQRAILFLKGQQDYLEQNEFIHIMGKVLSSVYSVSAIEPVKMIDRFPLNMPKDDLLDRYSTLNEAMASYNKCEIEYMSSANKLKTHIIHPYKLYIYNGSWFVLAWNETINDFGYFKLNRIEKIEKLRDHFTIMKTYKESDYLDSFGMKQHGDYYNIKLKLKDLYTVITERTYGKNQRVTKLDDEYSILECDMQNKDMILSFVLGFGNQCEVLEPEWLITDVKHELINIAKLYQR